MADAYRQVRRLSEQLCEPLEAEDCVIQSMPDASPIAWHLAHTTWFFETLVLKQADHGYRSVNDAFEYLYNSYYNQVGAQYPRPRRGLLSRPTVAEVFDYRRAVDRQMEQLLARDDQDRQHLLAIIELGLHHEQQHQELMLTDVKHLLSCNPLFPVYHSPHQEQATDAAPPPMRWVAGTEGVRYLGHEGTGFAYDNELPRHETLVMPHELASRLVTNGEYLEFIHDGGYRRPELWLSLGWQTVCDESWQAPLYWYQADGRWQQFTLRGLRPVDPAEPVCHVSYFEADAYARWRGERLPTEAEWELAATGETIPTDANFVDTHRYHPVAGRAGDAEIDQLFGDVWEWTASPYTPYPGYQPPPGAVGEYNGKFMCNQYVLRGGSCATSRSHIRASYRNFFPPEARWQFTGIRLAR